MEGESESTTMTLNQGAEKDQPHNDAPEKTPAPTKSEIRESKKRSGTKGHVQTFPRMNRKRHSTAANPISNTVFEINSTKIRNGV
jgi:hypothetical protein